MSLSHHKGADNNDTVTSSSYRSEISFGRQISGQSAKGVYTVLGAVPVRCIS